ncbi:ABC transporter permease [Candidatus Manganitrophus noduliformans]|uniref:ABC transporter permease n=1 Tax=Candidatus Manganitrophus noduliformans TaxID=2606439 RepID=A0A7X6DUA7_9BACT|nr:ABC transporter permease [Candidatus Manganitrophus noduliformans]NKE73542.1 ABC transporter permease [Candidatus Manganitrophus noduliformans]
MNIMLVSVAERTAEIGLPGGGGDPKGYSSPVSDRISAWREGRWGFFWGPAGDGAAGFLPGTLLPARLRCPFFFSVGVGLIFGLYPTLKAARLDPAEALRKG